MWFWKRKPSPISIAILSFNRPHYLREVLKSLRPQISRRDEIVLFQDGAENPHSGRVKASQEDIRACVDLFMAIVPWGKVIEADRNLGIALNYERAETYLFADRLRPRALFLEDDLVLSRHYLAVIRNLLELAETNERIAYVSAYGNMWASRDEQRQRRTELQHMHENWGYAMTRAAWLDERPFRERYLALVRDRDYSQRDHAEIMAFYVARGWTTRITSQDGARWVASLELGKVRLTSFACHARYIGKEGEHFTPQHYYACGFDRTEMYDGAPHPLTAPSSTEIDRLLDIERRRFKGSVDEFYEGHAAAQLPLHP